MPPRGKARRERLGEESDHPPLPALRVSSSTLGQFADSGECYRAVCGDLLGGDGPTPDDRATCYSSPPVAGVQQPADLFVFSGLAAEHRVYLVIAERAERVAAAVHRVVAQIEADERPITERIVELRLVDGRVHGLAQDVTQP